MLTQLIGTAIAHGQFARVPILNGITHDEEMIFVGALGIAVSGGTNVPVPDRPVTLANYETNIAAVLGVPDARAAAIAAEYPPGASADLTFSTLVADANFACPALQLDRWTAGRVPTYAYQFNDDHAPVNVAPPGALPPIATHGTELPYLFDQPNAPFPRHPHHQPADARRQHAGGLGELRRERQPLIARAALAVVRRRGAGDVAAPPRSTISSFSF